MPQAIHRIFTRCDQCLKTDCKQGCAQGYQSCHDKYPGTYVDPVGKI